MSALFGAIWWKGDARRTRRVLRRARVTPIADLADGRLACVVGRVEVEGDALRAMVSARECVAYDTVVYFFGRSLAMAPARVEVERRMVPFHVVDATGRVRIDAPQAALCNPPVARSERFEERVIEPGMRVRIVGSVVLEPTRRESREHGFRESAMKATLTGTSRYPLLVDIEPE